MRPPAMLTRLLKVVTGVASSRGATTRTLAGQGGATGPADAERRQAGVPARRGGPPGADEDYPGDFTGAFRPVYSPNLDGAPDPGEIVWTWVPYEEDHSRGKDRPVLVVGKDAPWLLVLMLTSKDHDARREHRDEVWADLGVGEWDARKRQSEVRVDRVIRIDPAAVRREGAVLDRVRFGEVVSALEGAARRRH